MPIDPNKVLKDTTFEMRYVGLPKFTFRLWLALQLFRLAIWITGAGFEFHGIQDNADNEIQEGENYG